MIIESILIIILSVVFFIYLRKWPQLDNNPEQATKIIAERKKEKIKKHFEKIKEPVSSDPEVIEMINKANEYFNNQEWKKAEKLYLKAASKDPKCSKAYSRLGVIYLKTENNYSDAEEAFKQAEKLDPKNGFILNNLGLVYYNQEKHDKAIDYFERSIKIDSSQASRHANLGIVYYAKRQYVKAERCLKKAVSLDPDNHEYHHLLKESSDKKKTHSALIR